MGGCVVSVCAGVVVAVVARVPTRGGVSTSGCVRVGFLVGTRPQGSG